MDTSILIYVLLATFIGLLLLGFCYRFWSIFQDYDRPIEKDRHLSDSSCTIPPPDSDMAVDECNFISCPATAKPLLLEYGFQSDVSAMKPPANSALADKNPSSNTYISTLITHSQQETNDLSNPTKPTNTAVSYSLTNATPKSHALGVPPPYSEYESEYSYNFPMPILSK